MEENIRDVANSGAEPENAVFENDDRIDAESTDSKDKAKERRADKRRKTERRSANRISAVFCVIFFMTAVTGVLYLLNQCVITDPGRRGGFDVINVLDESGKSFRDTQQFYDYFNRDLCFLPEGLAAASQLETDGNFDGEKRIDIVKYYYRKHRERIPEKLRDVHIEYKLADLLAWFDYGNAGSYELNEEEFSKRYPQLFVADTEIGSEDENADISSDEPGTDKVTVVLDGDQAVVYSDEYDYDDGSDFYEDDYGYEDDGYDDEYIVGDEEINAEYMDEDGYEPEEVRIAGSGEKLYSVINEEFLPVDGVSLYNRQYSGKGADLFASIISEDGNIYEPSLINMLLADMSDLHNNYEMYDRNRAYLTDVSNFKYVLLDPNGRMVRSNLRLDDSFMNGDRTTRNRKIENAIRERKAYAVYTFGTANVECSNLGGHSRADILAVLRRYDYSFNEGTKLMACVLDEDTSNEVLGGYLKNDFYGKTDFGYREISGKTDIYMMVIAISLILAFICLIVFTATVPALAKENIRGFHKVPTIVAACIMFMAAGLFAAPPLLMMDNYNSVADIATNAVTLILEVAWICFLVEILLFLYGWYSLVLRIKGKTFFSNSLIACLFIGRRSLCGRFIGFVFDLIGGITRAISDFFAMRSSILARKIVPYGVFLLVNFIIVAVGSGGRISAGSILLCLIIDAAVGVIIFLEERSHEMVSEGVERIVDGDTGYQIDTAKMFDGNKKMAQQVNKIGTSIEEAVSRSIKDERMKTELITNVSHDIKTPLTSIINYVDLLKRENIEGEKPQEYIRILDEKSQRLKVLIQDLVDASKISSGNITLDPAEFDMRELVSQSLGEFEDRLEESGLTVVYEKPEQAMNVWADSVRMWRVLENLMGNVCKYSMPGSRVYVQLEKSKAALQVPADAEQNDNGKEKNAGKGSVKAESPALPDADKKAIGESVTLTIKNISDTELNITADELMERFVRGDESRNTEGSGLGLSIARDLVTMMGGKLSIYLDGDLFKVTVDMPVSDQAA